jgi:hypothetical protein
MHVSVFPISAGLALDKPNGNQKPFSADRQHCASLRLLNSIFDPFEKNREVGGSWQVFLAYVTLARI